MVRGNLALMILLSIRRSYVWDSRELLGNGDGSALFHDKLMIKFIVCSLLI